MKKKSTKFKSFFIVFAIVFVLFFALAVLSNYCSLGEVLYCTLLFPFGFLHFILGNYLVNHYTMAHWVNNDLISLSLVLLAIIGQTFVYYYIYKFIKARKKRKMEIQE